MPSIRVTASSNTRPLSEKAQRFAEVWAGDNTYAAELAGYGGDKKSLGVIGARLRKDPRVEAIIAARRETSLGAAAPPPQPTPPRPARAPVEVGRDEAPATTSDDEHEYEDESPENVRVLKEIRDDSTQKASDRERAIARLERIADQRRAREAAAGGGDLLQRLQTAINEALRSKRAREREEEER